MLIFGQLTKCGLIVLDFLVVCIVATIIDSTRISALELMLCTEMLPDTQFQFDRLAMHAQLQTTSLGTEKKISKRRK